MLTDGSFTLGICFVFNRCSSKLEAIDAWVNKSVVHTRSTGVYVAQQCSIKSAEEGTTGIAYISASKGHEFILGQILLSQQAEDEEDIVKLGQGIVFELFKDDTQDNENEDDENAENEKQPAEPAERKLIHIPNVLIRTEYTTKLHFFKTKMIGSFIAIQFEYPTYLNAEAVTAES